MLTAPLLAPSSPPPTWRCASTGLGFQAKEFMFHVMVVVPV